MELRGGVGAGGKLKEKYRSGAQLSGLSHSSISISINSVLQTFRPLSLSPNSIPNPQNFTLFNPRTP
uniref:Uncharacterized protein n=1 Tax=Cucumis melo TaxID=3656 RepID=A0A9I9DVS5_CUCME